MLFISHFTFCPIQHLLEATAMCLLSANATITTMARIVILSVLREMTNWDITLVTVKETLSVERDTRILPLAVLCVYQLKDAVS